jgi:glycosyltransferase involved in cell wall biosynthesis
MTPECIVSVIIPLHNKGPYIKRAIHSVLQQTLQQFEIIIVDDHSTDDGPRTAREFQDHRITVVSQDGSGAASTRNLGVSLAKSDFIAFLDADDEWDPLHLETLVALRERFPEAGIWVTAYKLVEPGNIVRDPGYYGIPAAPWEGLIPNYVQAAVYGDFPFVTICVGISKKLFLETGGFVPHITWNEDLELWFRIILRYPVAFSWHGVAIWHLEATNRVSNSLSYSDIRERGEFVIRAMDAIRSTETASKYVPYLNDYIAKFEISRALWIIEAGYPREGRRILKEHETKLFSRKKRYYLLMSYVPAPVFRALWRLYRAVHMHVYGEQYNENPWIK